MNWIFSMLGTDQLSVIGSKVASENYKQIGFSHLDFSLI